MDLLQVESANRFSGMVSVTSGDLQGTIYFAGGEIVHAAAGALIGEDAMCVMVSWPEGTFDLDQQVQTAARSIHKSFNHLMLDCHRVLDETRRATPPPPPRPSAPPAQRPPPPLPRSSTPQSQPQRTLFDTVRTLKGVTRVVHAGPDGRPKGDESVEAEALAARGVYLAVAHGGLVAQAFGLGAVTSAMVSGPGGGFVVTASNGHHLIVEVGADVPVATVEAQLRQVLSRAGGR